MLYQKKLLSNEKIISIQQYIIVITLIKKLPPRLIMAPIGHILTNSMAGIIKTEKGVELLPILL